MADPAVLDAIARDAAIGATEWAALPPGAVRSRFAAPSGPLAVVSYGEPSAPRVVLVPGATGSKEDFVLMAPLLAEAGYFVQSFDLPGNFESYEAGARPGADPDYDLYVDDVVAFLEVGSPAHLLGYSFAGIVAQLVVARRPELVRSLTLLTTPPETGDTYRTVKRIGRFSRFVSARVVTRLMVWGIRANATRVDRARMAFVRSRFALTRYACIADAVALMQRAPDAAAAVAATGIPVLVATGEHDLWPVERSALFAERLGARLVVYPTGHSPCETTPHQLVHDMLALFRTAG